MNRREALSTVTLGAATMAIASPAVAAPVAASAELARLIETHRFRYAAMTAHTQILSEAQSAWFLDETSTALTDVKDATEAMDEDLMNMEREALVALLSHPYRDLAELRTVLTLAKKSWWNHGSPEKEEFDALLVGIMGQKVSA